MPTANRGRQPQVSCPAWGTMVGFECSVCPKRLLPPGGTQLPSSSLPRARQQACAAHDKWGSLKTVLAGAAWRGVAGPGDRVAPHAGPRGQGTRGACAGPGGAAAHAASTTMPLPSSACLALENSSAGSAAG